MATDSAALPPSKSNDANHEVLTELLAKNHSEHALLLHKVLHNHLPHLLASIFFLRGGPDKLKEAYEHESKTLESWSSTNQLKISNEDEVIQHLGDISYAQAYVEYFNAQHNAVDKDWKSLVYNTLIYSSKPLLSGVVGGFGHPLILFADAFELRSPELAIEALALNAIDYNYLHQFLAIPWQGENQETAAPEKILSLIANDKSFDGILSKPGIQNSMALLSHPQARTAILKYFLTIDLSNIHGFITELSDLAVLLECAVHKPGQPAFDFYLNHALTFVWSLKVLLPEFSAREHTEVLTRGAWLLILLSYITELRPVITPDLIPELRGENLSWEGVFEEFHQEDVLEDKYEDPHFLRALRNLMELGKLRKEKERWYMAAAVKLKTEWKGWSGLGAEGDAGLNV